MPIPRPLDRSGSASWSHGGFHDRPASTCPCLRGDSVISREHRYAQVKQGLSAIFALLVSPLATPSAALAAVANAAPRIPVSATTLGIITVRPPPGRPGVRGCSTAAGPTGRPYPNARRESRPPICRWQLRARQAQATRRAKGGAASRPPRPALAATRQVEGRDALASFNTQSMPPWLKFFTMSATAPPQSGTAPPQPELTATYCSPSCSQVIGEPTTPEPV